MIPWLTVVIVVTCLAAGVLSLVAGIAKRTPSDYTVGASALLVVLLIVQGVSAIASPFAGNPCLGDPVEFGIYLVTAILIAVGSPIWALIDRSRWSTVIMGVVGLTLAVMVYRMQVIWTTPLAG